METQAKHTPTPWSVHKNADGSQRIDGQGLASIAVLSAFFSELQGEQEANAEFTVKACNNYQEMRNLLARALEELYAADSLTVADEIDRFLLRGYDRESDVYYAVAEDDEI